MSRPLVARRRRRCRRRAALVVALLVAPAAPSLAEQAVTGARLVVESASRGGEWRNRVVFRSTDRNIVVPDLRGPDDPRCGNDPAGTAKAALQVFSPVTGQLVVYRLPCDGWRAVHGRRAPSGYRYLDRDRVHGPCRVVQLRRGRLIRASCGGSRQHRFALAKGRPPMPVAVQLVTGGFRHCAEFGQASVVKRSDGRDGRRLAARDASPPATCSCRVELVDSKVEGRDGVTGMDGPTDVAMTPDGLNVYVSSLRGKAVTAFKRDPATGKLAFLEAHTDGTAGVTGIDGAVGVAASPDGKFLYVTGFNADAVAVFSRKPATGRLAFVEAKRDGTGGVQGLDGATGIAVSPDGAHVYATGQLGNAVVVFRRDRRSGKLTLVAAAANGRDGVDKLGGANSVAVSPDGAHVYVTALNEGALLAFRRDAASGRLSLLQTNVNGNAGVSGLAGANGVAVSGDGSRVYVGSANDDAIVTFARDAASGHLTFIGKVTKDDEGIHGLDNPSRPTLSPDGACLWAGAFTSGDLALFDRTGLGTLRFAGAFYAAPSGARLLESAAYGVASPDGRDVYAVGQRSNALVAFRRETSPAALAAARQTPTRANPGARKTP